MRIAVPDVGQARPPPILGKLVLQPQVGFEVERQGKLLIQGIKSGLNGQCIDRPRHALGSNQPHDFGAGGQVTGTKAGDGKVFGQRVDEDDVGHPGRFLDGEKAFQREGFVGLVDDEECMGV